MGRKQATSRTATRVAPRSLRLDVRGAAIIEFAICGSAFIALLLASLVTALTMFAQQYVQTLTDNMARQVLTGKIQMGGINADVFKKNTCAQLPKFLSCSRVMVELRRVNKFSDADLSAPTLTFDRNGNVINSWSYDSVGPGDIAVLRIFYLWPVTNGPLGFTLANVGSNQRLLIGTQVFKAETFS